MSENENPTPEVTPETIKIPPSPVATEPTVEQRANQCLTEINGALHRHGFDIQVFHELSTVKNAQGGTEINVQHVQKFVPRSIPEPTTAT